MNRVLPREALADFADVPATSRWVRSAGRRLHMLDYGGDGVPLVVLPGITTPAIGMDFVARRLAGPVRPIVLDVRGRGLSDDGPSGTGDYAYDVEALVRDLDLRWPVLLGHSMGARIAAHVAARGNVPVAGAVLVDPPMSGPGRGWYPTPLETFIDQIAEARQGTTPEDVARAWPRWPRREQELRARWLASCSKTAVADTHAGFETENFLDVWPTIKCPTALLYGGESPVVTAAHADELAHSNPQAELIAVPGAGHMVFWDAPHSALELTKRILDSLSTSGPPTDLRQARACGH